MSPWTKVSSAKPDDLSSILRTYVVCCKIFDHTVNPKIVLLTEKTLFWHGSLACTFTPELNKYTTCMSTYIATSLKSLLSKYLPNSQDARRGSIC